MNWFEELTLLRGGLPTDPEKLEHLLKELGISQFNLWVTKFNHTGLDTNEAQRRIRETLNFRWGIKVSILAAGASILGVIASWIGVFH